MEKYFRQCYCDDDIVMTTPGNAQMHANTEKMSCRYLTADLHNLLIWKMHSYVFYYCFVHIAVESCTNPPVFLIASKQLPTT